MADLLTPTEYKNFQGLDPTDTRNDAQLAVLLPAASRAIRTYTGRQFDVTDGTPATRTYLYDDSGMLDIDDCTNVTLVTTNAGVIGQTYTLDDTQWTAMPADDSDVFYYLVVGGGPFFGMSPEMGFERNLDQYRDYIVKAPTMSVTATWGWPAIPDDVKLAAAWTVSDILARKGNTSDALTAESIEGYSRSWGARSTGAVTAALAIPNRARDLLVNYQRIFV